MKFFVPYALIAFFLFMLVIPARGEESVSATPSLEKTLTQEVTQEFLKHNYKKVIALYRDFAAKHPERYLPVIVKIFYSQSLADTGEIDDAIESLSGALADLPADIYSTKLQYDLANLLFLQKRYGEAEEAYRKVVLRARDADDYSKKAESRLALMKERRSNSEKRDRASLTLIDLETMLESGEIPEGTQETLSRIREENPGSPQAEKAKKLQTLVREIRTQKAQFLLDEARRLFDDDKKYVEVSEILKQIRLYYSDVCEMPSVEALEKAVESKLRKE